jgi:D-sedoheptulose 7-phosphate isomerase
MAALSALFGSTIDGHVTVIQSLHRLRPVLERIAESMSQAVLDGKKILWCGNGGSAADAQHLAAELVGRFLKERRALPSIALSTNTSVLTAIGNDYGYDFVFHRQVEALCVPGDVVVGISTSGTSRNVCKALEAGRRLGAHTIAFTGMRSSVMDDIADEVLAVPSSETPRIQEAHILCGHMLCDYIERRVCDVEVANQQFSR